MKNNKLSAQFLMFAKLMYKLSQEGKSIPNPHEVEESIKKKNEIFRLISIEEEALKKAYSSYLALAARMHQEIILAEAKPLENSFRLPPIPFGHLNPNIDKKWREYLGFLVAKEKEIADFKKNMIFLMKQL